MSKIDNNNLNDFVSKTATQWQEQVENYHNNKRKVKRAQLFALELLDYLDAQKITQKEFAERMNVTPQQVNKILRAKSNLTFDTLDKIEEALGITITSPSIRMSTKIKSQTVGMVMQVVHRRSQQVMETDLTSTSVTRRNPVLETTIESMNVYQYTAGQI